MNGRFLTLLCAAFLITAARGQGTINFNTFVPEAGVNAPVWLATVGGPGPGPAFSAGLYYSTAPGYWFLLPGSLTTFQSGAADPARAAYIEPRIVELAGKAPGDRVTVWMLAWQTSWGSFENSPGNWGISRPLEVVLGGGGAPPGNLPSAFSGMVVILPEPSVLAIATLSGALILLRRRLR